MAAGIPRLFTIAPDKPFLEVLAGQVLKGFPCTDGKPPGKLDLARWTILLPTRRAVRELEEIFFRCAGGTGVLLPLVRAEGGLAAMATSRPVPHITRNLVHYAAQLGWFFALTLIPIGQVVSIE